MTSEEENRRYAELQAIALNAARHDEAETLLPMLDAGLPVNLRDEKGNTLLMLAAYHGHPALVRALLERGADADARNDRQQTPLAGVAFKGHLEIARLLLDAGADPVADQGGGRTPEMFAAMFGHTEMVALISQRAGAKAAGSPRVFGFRTATLVRVTAWLRARFFRRPARA